MKKNMFMIVGILAMVLLASCAPVVSPQSNPNIRSMSVNGTGYVTLVPDIAYINIGVRSEADEVSAALNTNTAQAQAISDKLISMGLEEKDIQTTSFNVYPMQQYDMEGKISKTTYVVENTINVTVRDLAKLGSLLDASVKAGANNIYGINFDVEDKSTALDQARDLAIQDAREKAESIASAAGVKLGELQNVSVFTSGGITPFYDAKMGIGGAAYESASVPVAAGTLVITVEANLSYEIK
ncbi:MAG: SIMPL domain-containing protein [Anaerolineaceae bacterium]|nr:SIMPL domain-containing protein [Anaerolineaceae bacterium]